MSGKLLIIGTPIGNLGDLTPRMAEAMRGCDLLLCEDTRHSGRLLQHLGIEAKLESFHDHNEDGKGERMAALIEAGKTVGLISDAGLPVICDPGFALVRLARQRQMRVETIPGPFAGSLALVASGIAPLPFAFFGFTPHKQGARLDFYRDMAARAMTSIVYESPQRLIDSLRDALSILGDVEATVAREMTKLHEEIANGVISTLLESFSARETIRGEITIVFAAAAKTEPVHSESDLLREFEALREKGMRRADAIKVLAEGHGLRKNDLYKMLMGE
ncbi:MAG TPA: 16S rRNA (cytidine(1402)-2'-O)-methyltransferase [Thermoanaerobaculia bacterium]|nr:16S rRNA (cytidine(1402)-2'-O)-methyltransferase [Thermoanaerobaculia bacterium]